MICTFPVAPKFRPAIGFIHLPRQDWEWALDHSRREYLVRDSIDGDHPMVADDRNEAITQELCWYELITIVRLRDGRRWIFGKHSNRFPDGFENTDAHARARLGVSGR
jgi:hypothetical protein